MNTEERVDLGQDLVHPYQGLGCNTTAAKRLGPALMMANDDSSKERTLDLHLQPLKVFKQVSLKSPTDRKKSQKTKVRRSDEINDTINKMSRTNSTSEGGVANISPIRDFKELAKKSNSKTR